VRQEVRRIILTQLRAGSDFGFEPMLGLHLVTAIVAFEGSGACLPCKHPPDAPAL